jgi:hypothetical protein
VAIVPSVAKSIVAIVVVADAVSMTMAVTMSRN